jgi:hypothetical protein
MDEKTEILYASLLNSSAEAIEGQVLLELTTASRYSGINISVGSTQFDPKHPINILDAFDKRVGEIVEEYKPKLYSKVCQDLAYCQNKDSEILTLFTAVFDSLAGVVGVPVAPATLSVYIIKKKFLNKLCNC